jgi:WD40 repeat protein/serine/threonine protein kinase
MPTDFQRVQGVFQAVAELPPAERAAALERECGDDAELRRCVEALLKAHDDSGELPWPATRGTPPSSPLPQAPDDAGELPAAQLGRTRTYVPAVEPGQVFVGRYKLREKLGEGGMGVVFVAEQTEPVQRRVALKIIRAGLDTHRLLARFEQERQALALMDHPNIAKVFDAGVDPAGRPYFVMELVKGLPLSRYCDEAKLTPGQRLELFIPVCQAVQHAHQKGIIHRDLKPSNILVGLCDGRPVPKVIDFGVAKATGPRLTDQSVYTEVGSIIGTLEYMSPEQAEPNNLDIDTRSDVYALGVILYELLTGTVPFSRKELQKAGLAEMLRVIKEVEPAKPSTKLSHSGTLPSIAAQRHMEPRKLTALVRGELDWIAMKALEKDRLRRYETATGFAADVQRYLADEPVLACPPSSWYRFRKFARRNSVALATTLAVGFAVILGAGVALWQANRAFRAEALEEYQRSLVQQQQLAVQRSEYGAHMTLATQAWARGQIATVLVHLNAGRPEPGQRDLRSVAWYYLWRQCRRDRFTFHGHVAGVCRLAFSPDCKSLATASGDRTIKLWDVGTGRQQATLTGHTHAVGCVAFSPDGTILASGSDDHTVRLWDRATGTQQRCLTGHKGNVRWVAFSPSGTMLATSSGDRTIKLWDLPAARERATLRGHTEEIEEVRFSPDGKLLASCADDSTVRLWDVEKRKQRAVLKGHTGHANSVAFAPQGGLLASSGADGTVRLWDVANGRQEAVLRGHTGAVRSLAFSPDGAMLASASHDHTVKIWDLAKREPLRTLVGHSGRVLSVVFSRDGRLLATASEDGTAKLWDALAPPNPLILRGHTGRVWSVAFSPDGKMLASASWDSSIKLWDTATGRAEATLRGPTGRGVFAVAFSPDGKTLAAAPCDTSIELWDRATRRVRRTLPGHQSRAVQSVAFSPDGRMLASCGDDRAVRLWDVADGNELATLLGHTAEIDCVAFSPDGKMLASGCRDTTVRLWDLGSRREVAVLEPHAGIIKTVAFSPDGKTLAYSTDQSTILLWDVTSRRLRGTLRGHTASVRAVAFSPDGAMLASASYDGTARLWDLATGLEYAALTDHTATIDSIALSPNGKTLATASRDQTVRLWDLTTAIDEEVLRSDK